MKVIKGDLLESNHRYLFHSTNASGAMGAGVALAIKNKWPEVYETYKLACTATSPDSLVGKYVIAKINNKNQYVINLFGQKSYGYGKQARYLYIISALEKFIDFYRMRYWTTPIIFGTVWLGCQRGGLKKEFMKEIFLELEEKYSFINFHIYEI